MRAGKSPTVGRHQPAPGRPEKNLIPKNKIATFVFSGLAPQGITCVVINPGGVKTDMGGPECNFDHSRERDRHAAADRKVRARTERHVLSPRREQVPLVKERMTRHRETVGQLKHRLSLAGVLTGLEA